jgi:hypothetical protein
MEKSTTLLRWTRQLKSHEKPCLFNWTHRQAETDSISLQEQKYMNETTTGASSGVEKLEL